MNMDFSTANRVIFGVGSINKITELTMDWGKNALLVSGSSPVFTTQTEKLLNAGGLDCFSFTVEHEPTMDTVMEGVELAQKIDAQFVVCVGGGSAIDCGKAISALVTNRGDLLDYLEVVGAGKALRIPGLPLVAVPTTAGTGSEVTRNAVIGVSNRKIKVSLRSSFLLPNVALVDPALTLSLPNAVTASTGMDALTQLIEPFVCKKANWFVDTLCRDGIRRAALALPRVYANPDDLQAREAMSYASLLSGMALANAGLGAVHGFAGPIGGMFDAPHGALCATLLPSVVRMNVRILRTRAPDEIILEKYREIACLLTGLESASCEDGISWLEDLREQLNIPNLRAYGIAQGHLESIVSKAQSASSMRGNPVQLTGEELREILEESL